MFPRPTYCLPALIHLPVSLYYCSFAKSSFTFPAYFLSIDSFLKPSAETTHPDHQSLLICNPVVILQPWSFLISAAHCRCPGFWLKPVFSLRSITFPLMVSAWKHVFLPVPKMLLLIPSIQDLCPQVSVLFLLSMILCIPKIWTIDYAYFYISVQISALSFTLWY